MTITEMVAELKAGRKARRAWWNSEEFLYYVPASSYPAMTEVAKSIMDESGNVAYKEYIAIRCKDGEVGFYSPTQSDLLVSDWITFE